MKKSLNTSTVSILLLSIAFVIMSVGFAAYTQNLNINGTVTAKKAEWKVQFQDNSYAETDKSVKASAKALSGTSFTYEVTLNPGEFYESTVNVENAGTIAATLSSITLSQLDEKQAKYLKYTVSYNDTDYTASATGLNYDLAGKTGTTTATAQVKVRVEYVFPENATDLPSEDVIVKLTGALNYVQKATTTN